MRNLTIRLAIVAMALGVGEYTLGTTTIEQSKVSVESMTVAQLEAAGDSAARLPGFLFGADRSCDLAAA